VNGINNRPGRLQKIPSATKQNLLTKKLGLPVTTAKKGNENVTKIAPSKIFWKFISLTG